MLEIRNLVKVYKTKGGAEVRALDGVSVKFEEKGMVFLLGKSGSGKSTLLNLCGGLDSPDAGEIIIKGRSSKDFSQSDFDSYRNTFVGFVFQEYNILNEFSVEDNIALALELQGKNKNKEQVHSILAQVDLENFAKRKPATEEEITEALQNMLAFFEQYENDTEISGELNVKLVLSDSYREYCSTKIVGFYYAEINMQESGFFFSASDYAKIRKDFGQSRSQQHLTNYQLTDDAIYNSIVIPFPSSENLMKILRQENKYNNDDTCFFIRSEISDQLMTINDTIGILEKVFLWVGVVMAVFAMLLLFNFISVSITNKKKEIGILRAVGARSTDVFKIFYSESAIITAICFVLAMVASFVICDILNRQLAGTLGAAIFIFGPLSWLVLLGIAVVTSFIATFLPVYGIAKKKPVESIRAL